MRPFALIAVLAAGAANAATLDLTIAQGAAEPLRFSYDLNGERQTLDLRDSYRYNVAVKDERRNKEICREAEYRTGLVMTLRDLEQDAEGRYVVELVGQISNLKTIKNGPIFSCGVNQDPVLQNRAFSDTSALEAGRTKVLVIDGKTTVLMTVNP